MHGGDDNMVPVDAPENKGLKPEGGQIDGEHKLVMHQLNNLHQNACELLKHFAECSTPHLEEAWVKKKIILATDYLDSVRDYVMSSHGKGDMKPEHSGKDGFMVVVEKRMNMKAY